MYGQLVGGGPVHFTANYWRFHEIDFIEASKKGTIAGTGFADWPITYADLEPYYTKAEWDLGISGEAGSEPVRSAAFQALSVAADAGQARWHSVRAWRAQAGLPSISRSGGGHLEGLPGRMACQHCGWCEGFGCEHGAKSSPLPSMIPQAMATGRCEIRPHSYVRKVDVGAERSGDGRGVFRRAQGGKAATRQGCHPGSERRRDPAPAAASRSRTASPMAWRTRAGSWAST